MLDPLLDRLTRRGPGPVLHVLRADPGAAWDLAYALDAPTTVARIVRGSKARTAQAFFDECAAAWQFPPYFGANWDALDECLADLEWLPAESYVLVVTDSGQLLQDDWPESFRTLLGLLDAVGRSWPEATPAASFHVVFQAGLADAPSLSDRLARAGAAFDDC